MHKRTTQFEWHISASEADWERVQVTSRLDGPPPDGRWRWQRYAWAVAALLLLLAGAGGELWRGSQAKVAMPAPVKHDDQAATPDPVPLAASRSDDPIAASWWRQQSQAVRGLCATIQTAHRTSGGGEAVQTTQFQWDQPVACLVTTQDRAVAYRQTHFYRWTEEGWLPTAADPALWGPVRRLETPSFVYHFRQNDAPAVIAAASQMEALYTTLRQNFGLPLIPGAKKLVVDVSITQSPGDTYFQPHNYERFVWEDSLVVASPARYLAPVELTDTDLLAQSIALPLLDQALVQAREQHRPGAAWQPLLKGLRLWQLWDLDLPLATWREVVVKWAYLDAPANRQGLPVLLPERYAALCTEHKLWMPSPIQINIPLLCGELAGEDFLLFPLGWHNPPVHLNQLSVPLRPGALLEQSSGQSLVPYSDQTVALATLVDYAVTAYGRERLPALVGGLGQYESWNALLPAVFGVSAAEFEAGWQAYLAERYAISLP